MSLAPAHVHICTHMSVSWKPSVLFAVCQKDLGFSEFQHPFFLFFFIPDPGILKTLESHNLLSTQPSWMAEKLSRTTGYPAIECCCHRWPAAQLQRASCQEGRVGPQEEMFLSSSNLFSTIKEGPGSHSYSRSAYAAFFSWSKISASISNNNCLKRSRPFTGLQTAGSSTFKAEPALRNVSASLYYSCALLYCHFIAHLKAVGDVQKKDNNRSSYLSFEIPQVGSSYVLPFVLQSAITTQEQNRFKSIVDFHCKEGRRQITSICEFYKSTLLTTSTKILVM